MPILESVEWSGPALSLLGHCTELDPDRPAIMHVRHTERTSLEHGGASGDDGQRRLVPDQRVVARGEVLAGLVVLGDRDRRALGCF